MNGLKTTQWSCNFHRDLSTKTSAFSIVWKLILKPLFFVNVVLFIHLKENMQPFATYKKCIIVISIFSVHCCSTYIQSLSERSILLRVSNWTKVGTPCFFISSAWVFLSTAMLGIFLRLVLNWLWYHNYTEVLTACLKEKVTVSKFQRCAFLCGLAFWYLHRIC